MTDFTEIKSAIEDANKLTVALRESVESKADANTVATLEAKLAESISRVSALEAAGNRPGAVKGKEVDAHKEAFIKFMRKSDDFSVKSELQALEAKSVTVGSGANGGFAIPTVLSTAITRVATDRSAFRGLARVVSVSNENYTELLSLGNAGSGWAGEATTRALTDTPTFSQVKPTFGEVYAVAEVSNHALNDMFFDVEAWLIDEIATKFAATEGAAFLAGDGTDKPTGILNGSAVSSIASGQAAAFGTNPFDNIMDLRYSIKSEYAQNGKFLLNSNTLATLAKVKDTTGQYIYQPAIAAGVAETIVGKPVVIEEGMPNVGAGAKAVLFGDFARAYVIADLVGMHLIVDQVTKKGFTNFYVSKRVGGAVKDAAAVKALRIAAS